MSQLYYFIHTPSGNVALNGTFAPTTYRIAQYTPNLVRARGHFEQIDLSDRIPAPATFQLVGQLRFRSESELSQALTELNAVVRQATAYSRDERVAVPVSGAVMDASPPDRNSGVATVTITFTPTLVPDPNVIGDYF